ncbi:MAG: hypothetical protein JW869_00830 [Candidatus Omnitrophica bacterium]|nr:hypothetical protein [Candidatus Omnitrophota bacterium]
MFEQLFEDKFYTLAFLVIGVIGFFVGFMRLRRRRMVENIPTSTVRGLALGLVELIGKARAISKTGAPFTSPLTGTPCTYYHFLIERLVRSGRSSHWEKIAEGDSADCPFWLIDDTGKIPVLPKGAEIDIKLKFQHRTRGRSAPPKLSEFMTKYNLMRYRNYILSFKEWHIKNEQKIYVLGTAKKSHDFLNQHKKKLVKRLEELKSDPLKMSKLDLNKDGRIDQQEWDLAIAKVEQELLEESLAGGQQAESADVIVAKGDVEKLFMISDSSQKELISQLGFEAGLGIIGGGVLALYTFWSLMRYICLHF